MTPEPQTAAGKACILLRKMADNIERNKDAGFGGCFVIVAPENGGDPISVLLLDPSQDPAQFWGLIGPKATIALQQINDTQRKSQTFNRR